MAFLAFPFEFGSFSLDGGDGRQRQFRLLFVLVDQLMLFAAKQIGKPVPDSRVSHEINDGSRCVVADLP